MEYTQERIETNGMTFCVYTTWLWNGHEWQEWDAEWVSVESDFDNFVSKSV